jgi:hypothetical protein
MNKAREFLHNHPFTEPTLSRIHMTPQSHQHVIVDREDWEQIVSNPSLFVRFHRWMLENDTMEKAEQWANYDDEDMFRAFLIDQKLAK